MDQLKSISPCLSLLIFLSLATASFADICDLNVKVEQDLQNEGFHRKLNYNILFTNKKEEFVNSFRGCVIGVNQKLPEGVYVNPDEIEDLKRANQINVEMKTDVNVEISTELAKPMSFFLKHNVIAHHTFLSIPVHARYHQAKPGGGIATNYIRPPVIYVRCEDDRFKDCQTLINYTKPPKEPMNQHKWIKINYTLMKDTSRWEVPVGNTDQYYSVAVVTGLAIIIGSFCTLEAIHEFKVDVKKKKR